MAADEPDSSSGRSTHAESLWADVRVDPVEIALPGGVGYTLRAYRPVSELTTPVIDRAETPELDDFDAARSAVARRRRDDDADTRSDERDEDRDADEADDLDDEEPDEADFADDDDDDDEDGDDQTSADEDVPVFLASKGRLYLFHSKDKLVEFVHSGAEHDLTQLDTWSDLVQRIGADDVAATEADTYELDLLVPNLRGGPDAWEPSLILKAGEIARDLGYALRMQSALDMLSPGSPLDDLDETLRAAAAGGVGAFFARRKLRRIATQQAAVSWRTLIGKISGATDWRD